MNYRKLKKLDLESLQKLKEGSGPSDKCICSLLSPPKDVRKGFRASIKKAFETFGPGKKGTKRFNQKSIDIPLSALTNGGGKLRSIREVVRRKTSCGKCGCDDQNVVLKHSFANIKIISPDVSSFCPCSSDCLPGKAGLNSNVRVTVENLMLHDASLTNSEYSLNGLKESGVSLEPEFEEKSLSSLIDPQDKFTENNILFE